MTDRPLKIMYLNPVGTSGYDQVFADMARQHKLPQTEVHIASLPPSTTRTRSDGVGFASASIRA